MNRLIAHLFLLLVLSGLTACAEQPPVNAGNSPDEQRSHAKSAQDELSSEVRK